MASNFKSGENKLRMPTLTFYKRKNGPDQCPVEHQFPVANMRNISCIFCRKNFFVREPFNLRGLRTPLVRFCGHPVCEECSLSRPFDPCSTCGIEPQIDRANLFMPLHAYIIGIICANKSSPVPTDDKNVSDFNFCKSLDARMQQVTAIEHCNECGSEAVVKCIDCTNTSGSELTFCDQCFSKIHSFNSNQHHKKVSLVCSHDGKIELPMYCAIHSANQYCMWCEDCKLPCCHECIMPVHRGHSCIEMRKWNATRQNDLQEVYQNAGNTMRRILSTTKKVNESLKNSDSQGIDPQIEITITEHFVYLHGVLQNLEGRMIETVRGEQNRRNKKLIEIQDHLQRLNEKLQDGMLMAATAVKHQNSVNLNEVINKLVDLANLPCHLVDNPFPVKYNQVQFHRNEGIVEMIESHCDIETQGVDIQYRLLSINELPEKYRISSIDQLEFEIPELYSKALIEDISPPTFFRQSQMNDARSQFSSMISIPTTINDRYLSNLSLSSRAPAAKKMQNVRVTYFENPDEIYVRPTMQDTIFRDICEKLNVYNITGDFVKEVQINKLYAIQHANSKEWYRGRAVLMNPQNGDAPTYLVHALDIGSKELSVPKKRMRVLHSDLSEISPLAEERRLTSIVPKEREWSVDAVEFMHRMFKPVDYVAEMYKLDDENDLNIDLVVGPPANPSSVRDSLLFQGYGSYESFDRLKRINPHSSNMFHYDKLDYQIYYDVEILHIDNPDNIYIRKSDYDEQSFEKMALDLNEVYQQNKRTIGEIFCPLENMPCAALFENKWYRGKVLGSPVPRSVTVFLVDEGKIVQMKIHRIRRLDTDYQKMTTRAIKIRLRDVLPLDESSWSQFATNLLKTWTTKNVRIVAYEKIGDTYSVSLLGNDENLNSKLVESAQAISTGNASKPIIKKQKKKKSRAKQKVVENKFIGSTGRSPEKMMISFKKQISKVREIQEKSVQPLNGKVNIIDEEKDPFKVEVKIAHVISPAEVYLSEISREQEFEKMSRKLQTKYGEYEPVDVNETWPVGKLCVVYSKTRKMYYRGQIAKNDSEEGVTVFLIDLGSKIKADYEDLRPLGFQFDKIPAMVWKVSLGGMIPCGGSSSWPSSSCEMLDDTINDYRNDKFFISKISDNKDGCPMIVELFVEQVIVPGALNPVIRETKSVNKILLESGLAVQMKNFDDERMKVLAADVKKEITVTTSNSFVDIMDLSDEEEVGDEASEATIIPDNSSECSSTGMPDEETLPKRAFFWKPPEPFKDEFFIAVAYFVSMDGSVSIQPSDQDQYKQRIDQSLAECYQNASSESKITDWREGDLCIVKYFAYGTYHRGEVIKVKKHRIGVRFIDYGNVEWVETKDIFKKIMFQDHPRLVTKCEISEFKSMKKDGNFTRTDIDTIHGSVVDKLLRVQVLERKKNSLPVIKIFLIEENRDLIEYLVVSKNLQIQLMKNIEDLDDEESETEFEDSEESERDVVIESYIENVDDGLEEMVESEAENDNSSCTNEFSEGEDARVTKTIMKSRKKNDILPRTNGISKVGNEKQKVFVESAKKNHISPCTNGISEDEEEDLEGGEFISESPVRTDNNDEETLQDVSEKFHSMGPRCCSPDVILEYHSFVLPENIKFFKGALGEVNPQSANIVWIHVHKTNDNSTINHFASEYKSLMYEVQEFADRQPRLDFHNIVEGAPCCAKYHLDGSWYRCEVINPLSSESDPFVAVTFVDWGNTQLVQAEELREMRENWMRVPKMAIECRLWGVKVAEHVPVHGIRDWLKTMGEKLDEPLTVQVVWNRGSDTAVQIFIDENCSRLLYKAMIDQKKFFKYDEDYFKVAQTTKKVNDWIA